LLARSSNLLINSGPITNEIACILSELEHSSVTSHVLGRVGMKPSIGACALPCVASIQSVVDRPIVVGATSASVVWPSLSLDQASIWTVDCIGRLEEESCGEYRGVDGVVEHHRRRRDRCRRVI
jgi:hypothetical protein